MTWNGAPALAATDHDPALHPHMPAPDKPVKPPETGRRPDIASYFLRRPSALLGPIPSKMAPPCPPTASSATQKKPSKPATSQSVAHSSSPRGSPSPILALDKPPADSPDASDPLNQPEYPPASEWREFLSLTPTKQDINEMAASIVMKLIPSNIKLIRRIAGRELWRRPNPH